MMKFLPPLIILCSLLLNTVFADKPNILLIMSDDQGYYDVSYYGTDDLETPFTDSIAKEGMRFDNFYANSPVCSPTRASLVSGRYPEMVGVPGVIRTHANNSWGYLKEDAIMLPEMLKKAGYHTALIGKWHLGLEAPNRPHDRGFDLFHGFLGDMMDDYWTHLRHGNNYMRLNDEVLEPEGHATDIFSDWSVDYIKSREGKDEPFFLALMYNAPHFPVQPPPEYVEKVKAREPGITHRRALLVAFIEHMDDGMGRVFQALKDTGQYEDTLIIFTSDNGGRLEEGANNGPLRGGKQMMYEGGLKVPTVMSWPGVIEPGSVTDVSALTMDIFPTLCEIAGVEIEHTIDGRSFLDVLTGEVDELPTRPEFFIRREGRMTYGGETTHALRYGNMKLVRNTPYQPYELFNLWHDPLETTDLVDNYLNSYLELRNMMMQHIRKAGAIPWQPVLEE